MENSGNGSELVRSESREVVTTGGHRFVLPASSVKPAESTLRETPSTQTLGHQGSTYQHFSITYLRGRVHE